MENFTDENVNYDGTTLVLQALQVDPTQVELNDTLKIQNLYFYHFEEDTPDNKELFIDMLRHAITVLGVSISVDDTLVELVARVSTSHITKSQPVSNDTLPSNNEVQSNDTLPSNNEVQSNDTLPSNNEV